MSLELTTNQDKPTGKGGPARLSRTVSWLLLIGACGAGALALVLAVVSPWIEWRLLTLILLALASGGLRVEIRGVNRETVILPLAHQVMFASALSLGPAASAVPGAFAGIGGMVTAGSRPQPLFQILYAVLKPAAVCSAASAVYVLSGGSPARPQSVGAIDSVLFAAAAYAAASALLVGSWEGVKGHRPSDVSRRQTILAAWTGTFVGGYGLAALYASAPSYVLVAPAAAAVLVKLALRKSPLETKPEPAEAPSTTQTAREAHGKFVDPATGLANRSYTDMFLQGEISRSERKGKPVSAAVFDIRGYRRLVQTFGEEALEEMIADMGRRLKSGVRDYDLVARYTAGRLVVVLPETSAQLALDAAQRLHQSVASMEVRGAAVSVDTGVATFPDHASTAEELINAAHHALNVGRFASKSGVYMADSLPQAG